MATTKPNDAIDGISLEEVTGGNTVLNDEEKAQKEAAEKAAKEAEEKAAKEAAEAAAAKAKELGGTSFNETGDLLNDKGEVIKTKAELDGEGGNNDDELELLEDADGNITDKEGKVLITKDKVKKDADGNVILPDDFKKPEKPAGDGNATVIGEMQKRLGVTVNDEKGNPKTYEDTEEGLLTYVNDAAPVIARAIIEKTFEGIPDVQRYFYHRMNGGKPEEFFNKPTDWKAVKLDEKNKEQQLDIIRAGFLSKNIKPEQADKLTKMIADGDNALEEAKTALTELQENEKKRDELNRKRYEDARKQEEERVEKFWTDIKTVVDKGQLSAGTMGEVMIPESERTAFFDYLSKPVNDKGESQEIVDIEKDESNLNLTLSYLRFKKIDLNALIKSKANTQKASTLSDKLRKEQSAGKGVKVVKVSSAKDITLENVIS